MNYKPLAIGADLGPGYNHATIVEVIGCDSDSFQPYQYRLSNGSTPWVSTDHPLYREQLKTRTIVRCVTVKVTIEVEDPLDPDTIERLGLDLCQGGNDQRICDEVFTECDCQFTYDNDEGICISDTEIVSVDTTTLAGGQP